MTAATVHLDGLTASPGDHVCVFYRGAAERRAILENYLGDGVRAGTACLCVSDEDRGWLRTTFPDAPSLQVASFAETYEHGGGFDLEHMLDFWQQWGATIEPGGRTVSDMSWAERPFLTSVLDDFMSYEALATKFAQDLGVISLCLYDLDRLGSRVIIPALRAHPAVLVNGVLLRNPYCAAA